MEDSNTALFWHNFKNNTTLAFVLLAINRLTGYCVFLTLLYAWFSPEVIHYMLKERRKERKKTRGQEKQQHGFNGLLITRAVEQPEY